MSAGQGAMSLNSYSGFENIARGHMSAFRDLVGQNRCTKTGSLSVPSQACTYTIAQFSHYGRSHTCQKSQILSDGSVVAGSNSGSKTVIAAIMNVPAGLKAPFQTVASWGFLSAL